MKIPQNLLKWTNKENKMVLQRTFFITATAKTALNLDFELIENSTVKKVRMLKTNIFHMKYEVTLILKLCFQ